MIHFRLFENAFLALNAGDVFLEQTQNYRVKIRIKHGCLTFLMVLLAFNKIRTYLYTISLIHEIIHCRIHICSFKNVRTNHNFTSEFYKKKLLILINTINCNILSIVNHRNY